MLSCFTEGDLEVMDPPSLKAVHCLDPVLAPSTCPVLAQGGKASDTGLILD
jgi:hypothetical protein